MFEVCFDHFIKENGLSGPPEVICSLKSSALGVGQFDAPGRGQVQAIAAGTSDGVDIVGQTVIFAAEGFQGPADRLAEEMGMAPGLVFPIIGLPEIDGETTAPVIVYLGRDVVFLPIFNA